MHSSVEQLDLKDIERTARLLAEFIRRLSLDDADIWQDEIPGVHQGEASLNALIEGDELGEPASQASAENSSEKGSQGATA